MRPVARNPEDDAWNRHALGALALGLCPMLHELDKSGACPICGPSWGGPSPAPVRRLVTTASSSPATYASIRARTTADLEV
jgi:hypothetical protein